MSQINLESKILENKRVELHPGVVYFLGPGLTLRNCTLVLRVSSRNLIIPGARFTGCTFDVKKELKNFGWEHALLDGCKFTGRLTGNGFGQWPDSPRPGHIQNCDFSAAQLDGCRFLACDASILRFPPWPCFTLLNPIQRARELSAAPWPGDIGPVVMSNWEHRPSTTVAITYSAQALARRYGTTPEAIKATLEKLDGVGVLTRGASLREGPAFP